MSLIYLKSYLSGNIYFVHTLHICQLVIRLHHLYMEPTLVIGKKKIQSSFNTCTSCGNLCSKVSIDLLFEEVLDSTHGKDNFFIIINSIVIMREREIEYLMT